MFDLNWNDIIFSRFEDDNLINYHSVFFTIKKKQITEKQKTYIKNLFYQYYIPNTERQFEYFENKLNELNTCNASEIINGLLQKDKQLISVLIKYLEQFKPIAPHLKPLFYKVFLLLVVCNVLSVIFTGKW